MNPLTNAKNLHKLNIRELDLGLTGTATSWHSKYKDSAWVHVGGLPYDLTEGDVICVFSQFGEIVNLNLVRDKDTGKSRGFCFICYEDQRSTILAVDNLNTAKLVGRTIKVDHVENYKVPKEFKDQDELTKKLHKDGCAPEVQVLPAPVEKKQSAGIKKEKKKDKKNKKQKKVKDETASVDVADVGSKKKKKKKKRSDDNNCGESETESKIKLEALETLPKRKLMDDQYSETREYNKKQTCRTNGPELTMSERGGRQEQNFALSRNDRVVMQESGQSDDRHPERSDCYRTETDYNRPSTSRGTREPDERRFDRGTDARDDRRHADQRDSGRNFQTNSQHDDRSVNKFNDRYVNHTSGDRNDEQSGRGDIRQTREHNYRHDRERERRSRDRDNQPTCQTADRNNGNDRPVPRGDDRKDGKQSIQRDSRPSGRGNSGSGGRDGRTTENDNGQSHRDRNGDKHYDGGKEKYSGKHRRSFSDEDDRQPSKKR